MAHASVNQRLRALDKYIDRDIPLHNTLRVTAEMARVKARSNPRNHERETRVWETHDNDQTELWDAASAPRHRYEHSLKSSTMRIENYPELAEQATAGLNEVTEESKQELRPKGGQSIRQMQRDVLGDDYYLAHKDEHYTIAGVQPATITKVPVPERLRGKDGTGLLSHKDRQNIWAMQRQQEQANRDLELDIHKHQRRYNYIQRNWPAGVKGLDSVLNGESVVYGTLKEKMLQKQDWKQNHAQRRGEHLHKYTEDFAIGEQRKIKSEFKPSQKLQTTGCPAALEDTHTRLFEEKNLPVRSTSRAALRVTEARQRGFNILSGMKH